MQPHGAQFSLNLSYKFEGTAPQFLSSNQRYNKQGLNGTFSNFRNEYIAASSLNMQGALGSFSTPIFCSPERVCGTGTPAVVWPAALQGGMLFVPACSIRGSWNPSCRVTAAQHSRGCMAVDRSPRPAVWTVGHQKGRPAVPFLKKESVMLRTRTST